MAKLLSQNEVSLCYVFKVFLKRSSKQAWLLAIKIDLFECCSQSQRGDIKVNINNLNNKEIMLGMPNCEDELFVNHVLLIAKQYLYSCHWRKTFPIFKVFTSRLRKIQNLELAIAESKNKMSLHTVKWAKFDS